MPGVQTSSRNKNFVNTSKNLLKKWKLNFYYSVLFHMKKRVCLKNFVNYCKVTSSEPFPRISEGVCVWSDRIRAEINIDVDAVK